ncbi:nucleotide-binding domain-containing protein [Aspergillus indologenus CBS 114.80]|uniref:Nucleotide-binding domain-containing protein n=1 Tax=Aspergillus indologenus CBS 114.80 TaxID=1450541 RepID=A0A2V5I021_9EURO|nr:nucleotide-binding domain-containing protein [Aspergillus indologenus CBS 114.80]
MTKFEPEVDEQKLLELIQQDPGLPRDNPTASYWQHIVHKLSNVQSASVPPTTDIAIIGSGITGASVAKTILEQHGTYRVTLFEARTICSGATGRNGGQLAINAAENYVRMKMAVGAEMAGKIIRFNIKTLEAMREIAQRFAHAQDPELTDVVKLRAFKDGASFGAVCEGIKELERDHPSLKGVYTVLDAESCEKEHGVFGAVGGVLHAAGTVWPYRVVTNLLEALLSQYASRLAIETNTPVTQVDYKPSTDTQHSYILHSARGCTRATHVVYCTNGYTGHLLPNLRGILYPMKGTMTVQDWGATPLQPTRGLKASWAIHYLPYRDPETGDVADGLIYGMQDPGTGWYFFGGEKAPVEELLSANDTTIGATSVRFLQESVSSLLDRSGGTVDSGNTVVSSWSGIMGFSSDGLPLVGRLPSTLTNRDGNGEWFCGAFNGYGMPSAWLAGESLGLMIVGQAPREYLPEAFLISEERLRERLSVEQSMLHLADP